MKMLIGLSLATLVAAPMFTQTADAAPLASRSERTYAGAYDSSVDLTQSGPIHRGPIYRGYSLSDWYI
jgi:hypothetical protein